MHDAVIARQGHHLTQAADRWHQPVGMRRAIRVTPMAHLCREKVRLGHAEALGKVARAQRGIGQRRRADRRQKGLRSVVDRARFMARSRVGKDPGWAAKAGTLLLLTVFNRVL